MLKILHQHAFCFLGCARVRRVGGMFAGIRGVGVCLPFGWFTGFAGKWLAGSSGFEISGLLLLSPRGLLGVGVFRVCIGVPFSLFKFCPHSFADGGSRNSKINMQRANHLLQMMCYSINKVWLNLLACGDNLILLLLYSSFGYKRMLSKHVSITTSFRTTFLDITNYILQNGSQDKNLW